MRSRPTVSLRPIEPDAPEPPRRATRPTAPGAPGPRRRPTRPPQRGLRTVAEIPPRGKLLLGAALLAIVGFAVWVTIRLLEVESRPLAIVLIVLSYIGAVVVGAAVVTLFRLLYSLRALPYLLGRGARRLLTRRRS